jgi:hypothetical protein
MFLDIVISCFPQRWGSKPPNNRRQEDKAHSTRSKETPSVSRQVPVIGKGNDLPEPSGPPNPSNRRKQSPLFKPQIPRTGPPPSPGSFGMIGPTQFAAEQSNTANSTDTSAGLLVQEINQAVGEDLSIQADQPLTTTKKISSSDIPFLAPPKPVLPLDHENPLQSLDDTPIYATEKSKDAVGEDAGSMRSKSSSTKNPETPRVIGNDELDVLEMILLYLKGSARAPVTTVYDMANLITVSCANVFDQYSVPDAFQFLDFFERSIGNIVS